MLSDLVAAKALLSARRDRGSSGRRPSKLVGGEGGYADISALERIERRMLTSTAIASKVLLSALHTRCESYCDLGQDAGWATAVTVLAGTLVPA